MESLAGVPALQGHRVGLLEAGGRRASGCPCVEVRRERLTPGREVAHDACVQRQGPGPIRVLHGRLHSSTARPACKTR
jgi:hypothetical protein